MTAARAPRRKQAPPTGPLITVDVGNTDTVVGSFLGADLDQSWRISSQRSTTDEVRLMLEQMLRTGAAGSPSVLCSVVPSATRAWAEALRELTGRDPLEVSARTSPIRLDVTEPDSVGPDRIANALAGKLLHGSPCIVIDLGTATTFDCISKQGAFVGGAISPGLMTSADELFRRAARLSTIELRKPEKAVARTTAENLRVGMLWGYAGLVDALVRRMRNELGGRPKVVATGGLARLVAPECETVDLVDDGLTLKGLRLYWEASR
ncbi:MAG: type III pantothenate kinase [Candidatus Eisenbacteria bacterium]|nr:type III pantothenate kinase [Candidatus Eisenbacteria bacterium]